MSGDIVKRIEDGGSKMTKGGLIVIGLLCLLPAAALAQGPSQEEAARLTCYNQHQEYTAAQQEDGCTVLMDYWGRDPRLAEVYFNRGNAFYKLKDYGLAFTDFTNAIVLNPQYAQAYFWRSMAERASGMTTEADTDLARAKAIDPTAGSVEAPKN